MEFDLCMISNFETVNMCPHAQHWNEIWSCSIRYCENSKHVSSFLCSYPHQWFRNSKAGYVSCSTLKWYLIFGWLELLKARSMFPHPHHWFQKVSTCVVKCIIKMGSDRWSNGNFDNWKHVFPFVDHWNGIWSVVNSHHSKLKACVLKRIIEMRSALCWFEILKLGWSRS